METNRFLRVALLLQHRRPKEAEVEARQLLASDPADARGHALLALALTAQEKSHEAIAEAQQAVGLAPYFDYAYFVLSMVYYHADRNKEAMAAINEALRIDPEDADYYKMQGKIYLDMEDFEHTLESARKGLSIDPENVDCANLEAMALVHLGRQGEAGTVIETALRRDPENTTTHANMGWTALHAGRHPEALEHFREALRLNPNNEWARRGIVEAMKARSILYRPILSYFLWMERLPARTRWIMILGLWFLVRFLRGAAQADPSIAAISTPILVLYVGFVFISWISRPLFNLVLRLDKFGRQVLTKDETAAANWMGLSVFGGLTLLASTLFLGWGIISLAGLGLLAMSIPIAGVFSANGRTGRRVLTAYTIGLAVLGLLGVVFGLMNSEIAAIFAALFVIGWAAYTWVGNFMIRM